MICKDLDLVPTCYFCNKHDYVHCYTDYIVRVCDWNENPRETLMWWMNTKCKEYPVYWRYIIPFIKKNYPELEKLLVLL